MRFKQHLEEEKRREQMEKEEKKRIEIEKEEKNRKMHQDMIAQK